MNGIIEPSWNFMKLTSFGINCPCIVILFRVCRWFMISNFEKGKFGILGINLGIDVELKDEK